MSENNDGNVGIDKRKLTPAEKRRKENFDRIEQDMISKGYKRVDLTISIAKANTVGLLVTLPVILVIYVIYQLVNHDFDFESIDNLPWPDYVNLIIFLGSMVLFILIHEGIHGLCWSFGTSNHLKDIEFGFIVQMVTPYATCKVPLSKPMYIFGSLMPMTILGVIPSIAMIFVGNGLFLSIFLIQILCGAGDFLISLKLLKYSSKGKDVVLLDHPYECGLVAFEKPAE